ncbi:topless-related protein 4-like protein isoform X1 [Tanacetum coccineum]
MKRAHSCFSDLGTERFFGTVNGEIEGNNLMVSKSLILVVSTMLAGEMLSMNPLLDNEVKEANELLERAGKIYVYHGGDDIRNHLEIEAHAGSVNDLAFAYPNKILSIVTCGDDKLIKFNKDGILLAVSIHANRIKILANPDGVGLLRTTENSSFDPFGVASTPVAKTSAITTFGTVSASGGPSTTDKTPSMPPMTLMNSEKRNLADRPRIGDEAIDKSRMWKVTKIFEPSQCLSLKLPDNMSSLMPVLL